MVCILLAASAVFAEIFIPTDTGSGAYKTTQGVYEMQVTPEGGSRKSRISANVLKVQSPYYDQDDPED